jgi:hypothetical protein
MNNYRYAGLKNVKSPGLSVQEAARRLHRLSFVERRLMLFCVAHLVQTPLRDLKLLLGRAQFLAGERCTLFRHRLRELRVPKVRIENCPDDALELVMDEALHCRTDEEVVAVAQLLHTELINGYQDYLEQTNGLADAPSCDAIKSQLPLLREMAESLADLLQTMEPPHPTNRIERLISLAGGFGGSATRTEMFPPRERSTQPFQISRTAGRPPASEVVWDYIKPAIEEAPDYFRYMVGIRLSEINVAEGLAVVLYETQNMPWEFYHDLSRHLWDELRHSMMGEAAIESIYGHRTVIPMREYERVYCMEAPPLEQYATLGIEIEGGQMRYPVGKKGEWEFCRDFAKQPLMTTFQDFDWADEVLHVNLAKRQLADWFPGGTSELSAFAQEGRAKRAEAKNRYAPVKLSEPDASEAISGADESSTNQQAKAQDQH